MLKKGYQFKLDFDTVVYFFVIYLILVALVFGVYGNLVDDIEMLDSSLVMLIISAVLIVVPSLVTATTIVITEIRKVIRR